MPRDTRPKASLETLPVEVIQRLATEPPIDNLCSLRLTSRRMRDKSQGIFVTHFYRQKMGLDVPSLRTLASRCEKMGIASQIRHCTITCGMDCDEQTFWAKADEQLSLLTVIFRNLKKHIESHTLPSLSFRVALADQKALNDQWWAKMLPLRRRVVEITMMALQNAGLSVDSLDLSQISTGNSLAYDDFLDLAQRLKLSTVLDKSKRVKLSLMPATKDISLHSSTTHTPDMVVQSAAVASVLQAIPSIMPNIKKLDFTWVSFRPEAEALQTLNVNLRRAKSSSSSGKECYLHNLLVSEGDLVRFVQSFRPTMLKMKGLRLVGGTSASVLRFLEQSNNLVPDLWD
ncbi:hypothetical protein GGR51DRAFT_569143 [Nemania sp. FL0031]|nr:hypothetical protein GGR51DRAFT_569143 [Nemania sp. FL0031]